MAMRRSEPSAAVKGGLERLEAGRARFEEARHLAENGCEDAARESLESAMRSIRSAMNWLEGRGEFDEAHEELDRVGSYQRGRFGCWLSFEDGTYWQDCPVALAHNRIGFSAAYVVKKSECSICGRSPSECSHISGELYEGQQCYRLVTEADLLEVSLVGRPRQPDARIERISLGLEELQNAVDVEFLPGTQVSCDRCLSPCEGVVYPYRSQA